MEGEQFIKKAYEAILSHDFEQAIEWFEQAIALDQNNAAYHYKLSITYSRSNKLHKALEHAETACKLDSGHEEYRFHLQNLQAKDLIQQSQKYLHESGDQLHLAISFLKQAISLDSLALEAYLLMGLAYAGLGEYAHAIQVIREVIKLNPQHEFANKLLVEYQAKLIHDIQSHKWKD